MTVVDLSHPLAPGMPVHPGDPAPRIRRLTTLEREGWATREITLSTHSGTHLDAPSHLLPGAPSLDELPPETFIGRARVIDIPPGTVTISAGDLTERRRALEGCAFILLRTGWSRRWGSAEYFAGYPVLTPEAAAWLAGMPLRGIGVDAPSVDANGAADLPVHRTLLRRGLVILENLTGLERLPDGPLTLVCFPLPLAGADGSPVRAVALIDDNR